jgi:uncharacterized protein
MGHGADAAGGSGGGENQMAESQPQVVDNAQAGQFEIRLDGERAGVAVYSRQGSIISFSHTVIDSRHSGHGLGSALARGALDAARTDGLSVLPFCPFIRAYIEKHPEYIELVPAHERARFGLEPRPAPAEQ